MPVITKQAYIDVIHEEQRHLWTQFSGHLNYCQNGYWSIACERFIHRLVRMAKVVGPTPYTQVPVSLVVSKVYQEILLHFNIGHEFIPENVFAENAESYMEDWETLTIPEIRKLDKEGYL